MSKRLGLLHDLIPTAGIVGFLVNPIDPRVDTQITEMQEAAKALGLQLHVLKAGTDAEIDMAVVSLPELHGEALVVGTSDLFSRQAERLSKLVARQWMPTIYQYREYADAGGLISYGASLADAYRQVGIYAGHVLKGEKPADLDC